MRKIFITALLSIFLFSAFAQDKNLIIAFYNVENLFDTINDPQIKDEEFTPQGDKRWNTERYNKKLEDISKILKEIGNNKFPDIVGFAEVENRTVLQDLIAVNSDEKNSFKIVHEESPDARGIDVGLIYNQNNLKYISHKKIPVNTGEVYKVRDILYAKFILDNSDTIHIFVNHWKSRSGGKEKTEPQRIVCAQTLKNEIDSIQSINIDAKIIAVGDLNDEPTNKSVFETLKANNTNENGTLTNLMLPLSKKGLGSHSYRGNWSALDQIIVSNNLIGCEKGYHILNSEAHIFSADWITYTSKNGQKSPNRTYGGPNYYGGYSDHYPVFVILVKN